MQQSHSQVDKELSTFVETRLRYCENPVDMNDACVKFVKQKYFKSPEKAVLYGSYLVSVLYDWQIYPTGLVTFLGTFKGRSKFEDLDSRDVTERLVEILVKLTAESPHERFISIYFRLIAAQRFQNLKSKKLMDSLIHISLSCLGQYVLVDKFIYVIFVKLALKISDDVKEFKVVIADKIINMVFMLFSKIGNPRFLYQPEMIKTYLYFLKLLVTYGKEIVSVPSCSSTSHPASGGVEDKNENLHMIIKVLLMNMHFGVSGPGSYVLNVAEKTYMDILQSGATKPQDGKECLDVSYSDYNNSHTFYPEDDGKDISIYAKNYHSDQEVVDKIKSNSLKILTIFMRSLPDFFLEQSIMKLVTPPQLESIEAEEFTQDRYYLPHSLYNRPLMHFLEQRQCNNLMLFQIYEIISSITEADYLSHHKHVTLAMLTKMKNRCRNHLQNQGNGAINLVLALINESSIEIKAEIMGVLCTFQEVLHKRLGGSKPKPTIVDMDELVLRSHSQLSIVNHNTEALYTLFVLELYLAKNSHIKNILEVLAQPSSKTLWVHVPPMLKQNLTTYFVIPVFASCLELHYDFTKEFGLFLETIFEAGFSEYFLSKINYIKEILVHHIHTCRQRWADIEALESNLSIALNFIDSMLKYHPHCMGDILDQICDFYVDEILKRKDLYTVSHLAAKFLGRVLTIQRSLMPIKSQSRLHRSFSASDITLTQEVVPRAWLDDGIPPATTLSSCQRTNKKMYLELGHLVKKLYSELFEFATNQLLSDPFEQEFILVFTSIPSTLIYNLNIELEKQRHISIQDCLMTIFNKVNHKKNRLILVDGILSNQHMAMLELRKKMWANLFALYAEKSLSVEIVFTNYNIIYGLRNFNKILNDRFIEKVFYQTVSSLRSKNRKVVANCLKIFGYILGFYSFNILKWIVDADVPNVFNEDMQGEVKKGATLPCTDFLQNVYGKFLTHKYSKFNVISMECLENIIERHQHMEHPISLSLMHMVNSLADKVFEKLVNTESFKLKSRCLDFLLKKERLRILSTNTMTGALLFVQRLLEQDLESAKIAGDQEEYFAKQAMERDSLENFYRIEEELCCKSETAWREEGLLSAFLSCVESLFKRCLKGLSVEGRSSSEKDLLNLMVSQEEESCQPERSEMRPQIKFQSSREPGLASKKRLMTVVSRLESLLAQKELGLSEPASTYLVELKPYLAETECETVR